MSYPPYGGGYPPQPGYPSQPSYPPQPGGYPSQPGYPPQQGGYPPQPGYGAPSYPPQQNAYPGYQAPPGAGYPPQPGYNAGYPPQQPGYPPAGGGYPPQGGAPGYPPQGGAPGYPPQGGYPPYQGAPGGAGYQPPAGAGGSYPAQGGGAAPAYQTAVPTMHAAMTPTYQGTVKPGANFNAEEDAKVLRKAMKGFGTDEQAIINVLAYRSNAQRQDIKMRFKTMFGKDLISDLKSELGGHFESVILGLMMTPSEYDADQLREAMKGAGTSEGVLIEIMSTRSNKQIHEIKMAYKQKYNRDLEKDLMNETSGHFKRLMVGLCCGNRVEGQPVNMEKARKDAQELYNAGERMIGTDESKFNSVLCSDSFEQLRAVFAEYKRIANRSIEQSIRSEMSGDLEKGMISIVKAAENMQAYFADRLYHSMKGFGTKDDTLVRVIVTRCEVDMVQIKQEFQKLFGKTLESMIEGDLSGDYKKMLQALVRG